MAHNLNGIRANQPMLATPSTGAGGRHAIDVRALIATGDWVADLKCDGIRAMYYDGRFTNRRGVDITHHFPEITGLPDGGDLLDGEITALDGKFETVATRNKQESPGAIARGAQAHPCRFVVFDMPTSSITSWSLRRSALELLQDDTGIAITPVGDDLAFIDLVASLGLEGVIAKRRAARYQFGRRSPDWVKWKNVHRISCLISGYEPGTGSREHFGAMSLALIDERGQVVSVGKVGSGFTGRQTWDLKARLDRKELLVAEIECLNLTSGHALRFPVFRELRFDIDPADCTTAQLAVLPRSS